MDFREWEPTYLEICRDFGFSPEEDDASVRLMEAVTCNLDLDDEDCLEPLFGHTATVFGPAPRLAGDVRAHAPEGTLIVAGSACSAIAGLGIRPDILVTDLDGEIGPQLAASADGAVTLILAHGDNTDLIAKYAPMFEGKVVLTTQSRPHGNVLCFGGFTDGDRAVCLARHFGTEKIVLEGFDFDNPSEKPGSDPAVKKKKLGWCRRIINPESPDILIPRLT